MIIQYIYVKWTEYLGSKNMVVPHLIYRHLLVDREFVVVSHLKIFPLQLLGPAEKPMAGPSSCKGKILRWDTTTNSLSTSKCLYMRCDFGQRDTCNHKSKKSKYRRHWQWHGVRTHMVSAFFVTDCAVFISSMSGLVDKIKYQNNLVLGKWYG